MFNKYNLLLALVLISSFIFGYKGEEISDGLKKIFFKKEVKTETAVSGDQQDGSAIVNPDDGNKLNPADSATGLPSRQNPETLGKTLDSISSGTIPEEQIRKHQEYLKNITTKLKDFQGGEANIPPAVPSPTPLPAQPVNPNLPQNAPSFVSPLPPPGAGFEQATPLSPVEENEQDIEETDDSEDPDEADDTEVDEEEPIDDETMEDESEPTM